MQPIAAMNTWRPALLILAATVCLANGSDQEVRVPQGANITVLCSYSGSVHSKWPRVKTWYRQEPDGLVPLGRTDGWVAPSHRGRLTVSDLRQSKKMQVVLADVGDADVGVYSCAVSMLQRVHVIRWITLRMSHGRGPGVTDGQSESQTPDSNLMPEPERTRTHGEHTWSFSDIWGGARWAMFWLMTSVAFLGSVIIMLRKGERDGNRLSAGGGSEEQEEAL